MSKIPESIIDSLFNRKCLFFIGSGMSTEAGLPSSQYLADILAKKLESATSKPSIATLQKAAEGFFRQFSRPELLHIVRNEIVKKLDSADRRSFDILAKLTSRPRDIITTNWDPLIEEQLGRTNFTPIFEPSAVARYDDNAKINFFKIHGDIDREIVITEDDYRQYRDNWKPVVIKLLSLFQERVVVFIGYSTDDDNFLETYMEVFKTLGPNHLLPRYCVDPNIDEAKEEILRQRGIKPIRMSAREFLEELDKELQERLPSYQLPSPKTVPVLLKDYNPFGIFRAEELWCRRDQLRDVVVRPCLWGLVLLVLAQGLRLSGLYYLYSSAEMLSIVLTIAALALWLAGRDPFRKVWTLLAFLLLMLPWPHRLQDAISLPLQEWSTASAVFGLDLTGYDVVREGNVIHIGDTSVAVAEACNGLRMITAFFVISGLVVLLVRRTWWEKLIVLVSSLPIALICNTLRLAVTSVAFTIVKGEAGRKGFHDFGGYAMMPLALAIVVGELWMLSKFTTRPITQEKVAVIRRKDRRGK